MHVAVYEPVREQMPKPQQHKKPDSTSSQKTVYPVEVGMRHIPDCCQAGAGWILFCEARLVPPCGKRANNILNENLHLCLITLQIDSPMR